MLRQKLKKMTLEVKEEVPEDSWEIVSHWDDNTESNEKRDEDIKPKYDRRNEFHWDEGTEVHWNDDTLSSHSGDTKSSGHAWNVYYMREGEWCEMDSDWLIGSSCENGNESDQEKVTEPNRIESPKNNFNEDSKYKAEKVMKKSKKKKKSPSTAARVSAFWVFAMNECGWTGLKGADLAFFAGRPGGWPSLRPEEKQKYVEEAKKITKKNRAKLSAN